MQQWQLVPPLHLKRNPPLAEQLRQRFHPLFERGTVNAAAVQLRQAAANPREQTAANLCILDLANFLPQGNGQIRKIRSRPPTSFFCEPVAMQWPPTPLTFRGPLNITLVEQPY